jgi:hypothetical protein
MCCITLRLEPFSNLWAVKWAKSELSSSIHLVCSGSFALGSYITHYAHVETHIKMKKRLILAFLMLSIPSCLAHWWSKALVLAFKWSNSTSLAFLIPSIESCFGLAWWLSIVIVIARSLEKLTDIIYVSSCNARANGNLSFRFGRDSRVPPSDQVGSMNHAAFEVHTHYIDTHDVCHGRHQISRYVSVFKSQ